MTGVERIARVFARCALEERAALIPFLTAGDPDYATTVAAARAAAASGADIVEIGFPFSDPVADGPVIQASYTRARANGATTAGAIAACREIAETIDAPIVVMTALNLVLARGVDRFCSNLASAGVSGLLVPDLLADDAAMIAAHAGDNGIATVFLAGPSSSSDRLATIAAASTGFIYVVRRSGVTGAGGEGDDLEARLAGLRQLTQVPLAVGFGISSASDVADVARVADGVIVGSALVDAAHRAGSGAPDVVADTVRSMASAAGRRDHPSHSHGRDSRVHSVRA